MRFFSFARVFLTIVALFGATTQFVLADEAVRGVFNSVGNSSGFKNICGTSSCVPTIVGGLVNLVVGLLGVVLVAYIFYAGYLWMTSAGEEKKIEDAQQVVRNAIIGVLIVGLSFTIGNLVLRVITDAFQPSDPPIEEVRSVAPGTESSPGSPPAPAAPAPYINPSCRRSSCTIACILAEACAARRGQAEFTCETRCRARCEAACALDGAGSSGSEPPMEVPRTCRNPAGYRTCQSACLPAATARVASITDLARREARFREEFSLCSDRCTREQCSP